MSDRKYRHRGYQDGGSFEGRREGRRAPTLRAPRPEGPRGRGLGAPSATVFRCRACGAQVQLVAGVELGASCRTCGADLRCCANCSHFDTSRRFECTQPVGERIANKVRANTCSSFEPRMVQEFAAETPADNRDPRAAFAALFRK